ncbi:MAG: hypothetical protein M1836_002180 [Candelina mexicana]|nr:MAG: hypothetical protein M1836_002180 [Candelina mexicana]
MAVATPQAAASAQEWDEAEFEAGLARLKELHIQLRNLRTTIPRMIQPFVANHSSPEDLYDDFSKAAVTAATEIKDFRKIFEDRKTMLIFTNGSLSRRGNSEGISTWRVTEHPDWLDRDEGGHGEKGDGVGEVEDELDDGEEEQDVGRIVEAFTTSYQKLKVQYNEGSGVIKVIFPNHGCSYDLCVQLYLAPAQIHFQIQPSTDSQGKTSFEVTCAEKRFLHAAILECVTARPRPHDLNYLLEMLASYADVMRRPCDRCGKLLNSKPQLATGRRRIREKTSEGQVAYSWEAYH